MTHALTIASRELRSLFVSPVAYVVLTLWSVIAGTFFLASLIGFQERLIQLQQYQMLQQIELMNLNDELIEPFIGSIVKLSALVRSGASNCSTIRATLTR